MNIDIDNYTLYSRAAFVVRSEKTNTLENYSIDFADTRKQKFILHKLFEQICFTLDTS